MQAASAQGDFITPPVVSAAEADYERNLANTIELFAMLGERSDLRRPRTRAVQQGGSTSTAISRMDAANRLQPIWSQPRVKVATFADALGHAKNRIKGIAKELGLTVPANLAS